jgi:hypothetical protein
MTRTEAFIECANAHKGRTKISAGDIQREAEGIFDGKLNYCASDFAEPEYTKRTKKLGFPLLFERLNRGFYRII